MGNHEHHNRTKESLLIKAGIAGGVCAVVSAPLNVVDVTKIRMQNQSVQAMQYTGLLSGIRKIFHEEGMKGLTKGLEASMLREITYSSIRIGGYEPIRRFLSFNSENPADANPAVKFSSALMSGGIGSALANPLDLIKTRFQASLPNKPAPYQSTFQAIRVIYSSQGVSGLYKGWIVTSARAAVLTSTQLGSYDSIKHNLLMNIFEVEDGFYLHVGAAMSAGIVTTTAANPFDVIKTRYLSDSAGRYQNILHCISQTFKQDSIHGFFKVIHIFYCVYASMCRW
jgi:hypothetical protein